ncbi:MAG: hypothetical protein KatS3mg011_1690 [Acidimicrobiia bacterium]|nr:MAG: hypothetical protein KatS3mg011_1690 [Acidimicrobiia bacterium]
MRYQWAVATHQGRVRRNNQDYVHPQSSGTGEGPLLVVVADGMGGHVGGEVASRLAVERAVAVEGSPADKVKAGNLAVFEEALKNPELAGMGTTMTLVEFAPDGKATIAHVGDSRAYLLREGELTQLTSDHTVVAEQVRAGRLTVEEAAGHPQRSMLTRALGLSPDIDVDVYPMDLAEGDRVLVCSDGVNSMLDDEAIAAALKDNSAEEAVWTLVEEANRAGGHDNITAVVVDVLPR